MAQRYRISLLAIVFAACTSHGTRIHLGVVADSSWGLDKYQLQIGSHGTLVEPITEFDVQVPDDMAGHEAKVELWGLAGGKQVAYGTATITPVLHETVDLTITLGSVSCGAWCTEGAVECAGDGTMTCEEQSDGCLGWSASMPCPSDVPSCSNGACSATCTDECASAQTECDSALTVRTCGQYDSDSCLDWSAPMACPSGQTCQNGSCGSAPACSHDIDCNSPPPKACVTSSTLRNYAAPGRCTTDVCAYDYSDTQCPGGCSAGACLEGFVQLSAGSSTMCGLKTDGSIACWGETPEAWTGPWLIASAGVNHGCGVLADHTLDCWGDDTYGELNAPGGTYSQVVSSVEFSCALATGGAVTCWGIDVKNQLNVPSGSFVAITAGGDWGCALAANGAVTCWGTDAPTNPTGTFTSISPSAAYEDCGIRTDGTIGCWGDTSDFGAPPSGTFTSVAAGNNVACAIKPDKTLACWGSNNDGELDAPTGTFRQVVTGDSCACALRTDLKVLCWGRNDAGQTQPP